MMRLSRNDIEQIAEEITTAYINKQHSRVYYIDPVQLCEQLLGLTVDYHHLSPDYSILGLTSFSEVGVEIFDYDTSNAIYYLDGKTVLIESSLQYDTDKIGRRNFTIAHEASHQILKMLYPDEYGATSCRQIHYYRSGVGHRKITDWGEWQANTLGSATLMPRVLVTQAMSIFSFGEKIELPSVTSNPSVCAGFTEMASFLGCSKTALAIRMKYLGLLSDKYIIEPDVTIDVREEDL